MNVFFPYVFAVRMSLSHVCAANLLNFNPIEDSIILNQFMIIRMSIPFIFKFA